MSSYVNVTLDTTGPQGVSVCINGDEERTSDTQISLAIGCSDSDTTNYQMKIWCDAMDITEEEAQWEDYSSEKSVTINHYLVVDNTVTVYVRLRDDVWNESVTVFDSITVYTENPTVNIANITRVRISKIPAASTDTIANRMFPRNKSVITFTVDRDCDDVRVMVVEDINALYDDPANVLIPIEGGSSVMDADGEDVTGGIGGLSLSGANANASYLVNIKGADLETASPGDGIKVIKIFAHEYDGNWSI
ncbi:MAG: hypothetical protein IJZ35_04970 [Clostridia bacterium]|nr:hypothetical protein [Clostridia bacterium]